MKRLHKQYFPSHHRCRDFNRAVRHEIERTQLNFGSSGEVCRVSIKGIENAFDKRTPRNSKYGTSISVFTFKLFELGAY